MVQSEAPKQPVSFGTNALCKERFAQVVVPLQTNLSTALTQRITSSELASACRVSATKTSGHEYERACSAAARPASKSSSSNSSHAAFKLLAADTKAKEAGKHVLKICWWTLREPHLDEHELTDVSMWLSPLCECYHCRGTASGRPSTVPKRSPCELQ